MKLPVGTYSFYNAFENCPHKAFQIYVAKSVPYVETPEMKWGNDVHTAMDNRIKHGTPLPEEMKAAESAASLFNLMSQVVPVHVEYKLAMTKDGKPCDYRDWDRLWFRGKLDCVTINRETSAIREPNHAWLVDWKTGSVREEPFELETNALLLKVNYPTLETIQGEYFWMKSGQNGLRYTLNNHSQTFVKLQALRTEAEGYMLNSYGTNGLAWPKRKNPLCGWCGVMSCENNTSHKRKA